MTRIDVVPSVSGRRGAWLLLGGLLLALAGVPLYVALIDVPMLRATGVPALGSMGLGAMLAGLAWRYDRRKWVRIASAAELLLIGALVAAYYTLSALPAPSGNADTLVSAPDFTLPDHTGREVSLEATRSAGPVLLVFYRGHW